MKQKNTKAENQVYYLGRWVSKDHFRTFVYSDKEQKLASSWEEYEKLIASGLWTAEKPVIIYKKPKKVIEKPLAVAPLGEQKNGTDG